MEGYNHYENLLPLSYLNYELPTIYIIEDK